MYKKIDVKKVTQYSHPESDEEIKLRKFEAQKLLERGEISP